ncbi:DUF3106 domain-containing protein [Caenimonas terrae]|uniref:DUF3106 domain-containing protein n=1 Tax=Caenimonas terrae TaxID=696074 RepID=A0ABW0NBY9_9BURK
MALAAAGPGHAQGPLPADGTGAMGAGPARSASAARPSSAALRSARSPTSPLWTELTPPQQQALAPLATIWPTISEAQKRKWLVISQRYARLPQSEQAKLYSRMTEWVALSPQQRIQARLNFAESKQLSADDKKAKWEEYKALPPEEKRKLAAGAASAAKPPATAAAVKPVPSQKLAIVPRTGDAKPPRIAAAPNQVDHNTLLPQPVPPAQPAASN